MIPPSLLNAVLVVANTPMIYSGEGPSVLFRELCLFLPPSSSFLWVNESERDSEIEQGEAGGGVEEKGSDTMRYIGGGSNSNMVIPLIVNTTRLS